MPNQATHSCPDCVGTGECPRCDGFGQFYHGDVPYFCEHCHATGRCPSCQRGFQGSLRPQEDVWGPETES